MVLSTSLALFILLSLVAFLQANRLLEAISTADNARGAKRYATFSRLAVLR